MEIDKITKGSVYRVDFHGKQFSVRVVDKAIAPDGWWICENTLSGATRVLPSGAFMAPESDPQQEN